MATHSTLRSNDEVYKRNLAWPLAPWQTRLVNLLPGHPDSDLECELHVVDIIADGGMALTGQYRVQEYEALSYAWGKPECTQQIRCNTIRTNIPPGLSEAIQSLRLKDKNRWLWCDALCINQEDPAEKSAQVLKIPQIFGKASRVVAWLGQVHDDMQQAFAVMEHFSKMKLELSACLRYADLREAELERRMKAIRALAKVQWFRRIWVRQEVWANKNLVLRCGSLETAFTAFVLMIQPIRQPLWMEYLVDDYRRICKHRVGELKISPQISYCVALRTLLHSGRIFEASDDRDRIFALVGMLRYWSHDKDSGRLIVAPFLPDYSEDLNQIYQYFTKFCINHEKNLACLDTFEDRTLPVDLPSWVADWRQIPSKSFHWKRGDKYYFNSESIATSTQVQSLERIGELVLTGTILGEVRSDVWKSEAFENVQVIEALGNWMLENPRHVRKALAAPVNGDTYAYAGCWVPHFSREGDLVVLLDGGVSPFVLRPGEIPNTYLWIGAGGFWCIDPRGGGRLKMMTHRYPSNDTQHPELSCEIQQTFSSWLSIINKYWGMNKQLSEQKINNQQNFPPVTTSATAWLTHLTRVPCKYRQVDNERWVSGYRPLRWNENLPWRRPSLKDRELHSCPKTSTDLLPQQQFVIV